MPIRYIYINYFVVTAITSSEVKKDDIGVTPNPQPQYVLKSLITKGHVKRNGGSDEMIYIDTYNGQADTITIFVEVDNALIDDKPRNTITEENTREKKKEAEIALMTEKQDEAIVNPLNSKEVKKGEKNGQFQFLDIEIKNPQTEENKKDKINDFEKKVKNGDNKDLEKEPVSPKPVMINSDCINFASEEDFLKLRKKMVSAEKEENMLATARKFFKTKCFTTEQVKNLCVLFLKDSGKYNFFDIAYPFVSDSQNYGTLENQLVDAYYINRFRVMIRH